MNKVFDYTRPHPTRRVGYVSKRVLLEVDGADHNGLRRRIVVEEALVDALERTIVREDEVVLAYLPRADRMREIGDPSLERIVEALTGASVMRRPGEVVRLQDVLLGNREAAPSYNDWVQGGGLPAKVDVGDDGLRYEVHEVTYTPSFGLRLRLKTPSGKQREVDAEYVAVTLV